MTDLKLLLPDQVADLKALEASLGPSSDFETACRMIAVRLSEVLDSPTGLVEGSKGALRLVAAAGAPQAPEQLMEAMESFGTPFYERFLVPTALSIRGSTWTFVSLGTTRPMVLFLGGDWTLSESSIREHVERLASILNRRHEGVPARRVITAYALARRLARATDRPRLCQLIVDTCAKAVLARKVSIAVYQPQEQTLSILATFGYPGLLVQHLRCQPGVGVIGSVFSSGRPLLVRDVRKLSPSSKLRLRYHTRSFVSVPVIVGGNVIAVISLTDRRDGGQFDRRDVTTIRGLAEVAGLALDRLQALEDAKANAHLAAVDPVTGLYNLRYFLARLVEEMERARRQATPLTVMLLDVDGFKQLNDRLGHAAGDAVLRAIAGILQHSVRLFDICCRYGGDEFAILMPGSSLESSAQIAERIRAGVEECRPPGGPLTDDVRVSASIGIAAASGDQNEEDVIARADFALYAAKREGKNRANHWPAA